MSIDVKKLTETPCEFHRLIDVKQAYKKGGIHKIHATEKECHALKERLGLININDFQASFDVEQSMDQKNYTVKGTLSANIDQECILTLSPLAVAIKEPFEFKVRSYKIDENDIDIADDSEYSPTGRINIGEIVTQYLIVSLNPFPRSKEYEGKTFSYTL